MGRVNEYYANEFKSDADEVKNIPIITYDEVEQNLVNALAMAGELATHEAVETACEEYLTLTSVYMFVDFIPRGVDPETHEPRGGGYSLGVVRPDGEGEEIVRTSNESELLEIIRFMLIGARDGREVYNNSKVVLSDEDVDRWYRMREDGE